MEITIHFVPEGKMDEFLGIFDRSFACADEHDNEGSFGERTFHVGEINYGGYSELEALSLLGVTFEGWHGAGGEYEAARFISFNGAVLYASESGPVAHVDAEGNVNQNDLEDAVEYHHACLMISKEPLKKQCWPGK